MEDISSELKQRISPCTHCHCNDTCDKDKWLDHCLICRKVDMEYNEVYNIIDDVCSNEEQSYIKE